AAEGRDRDDDERRVRDTQRPDVEWTVDDVDVGAPEELLAGVHGALRGVQELEQRARPPRAHRVAAVTLDLHHVGARVGQHLRAVGAGDPRRSVQDTHSRQHGTRMYTIAPEV